MVANAQTRQQAIKSTMLGKAMRWWMDGWVMFVRSGGGTVDALDQRRSSGETGRLADVSHD